MKPFLPLLVNLWATAAIAEAPNVVADIPPVHSLVAQVMGDLGTPGLMVTAQSSPHSQSLRPSQAKMLQSADIVFWIGPELTPWMKRSTDSLAADATSIELLWAKGTTRQELRHDAIFEEHDEHEHDHGESGIDPHAWLDPKNAKKWLGLIADSLSQADPENETVYRSNAEVAVARLDALVGEVEGRAARVKDVKFVVFHDAYRYFEARFGLGPVGSIKESDGVESGAARISELREGLRVIDLDCAFVEPQFDTRILAAIFEDQPVKQVELDPLGLGLPLGADLYPNLIRGMVEGFEECAAEP